VVRRRPLFRHHGAGRVNEPRKQRIPVVTLKDKSGTALVWV
jgi:hypothetical protein